MLTLFIVILGLLLVEEYFIERGLKMM